MMTVGEGYQPADDALEGFLLTVGRLKYLRPIYAELVLTPDGRERAETIYERARPGYHAISQRTIDGILAQSGDAAGG